jgi:hypothetical protein
MSLSQDTGTKPQNIEFNRELKYLGRVSLTGTLNDSTCDITISLASSSGTSPLAEITIINSEPSTITAIKELIEAGNGPEEQALETLARVIQLSNLTSQQNSTCRHQISASPELVPTIENTYQQARQDIGQWCPDISLAQKVVGALKTLHSCYECDEHFDDFFENAVTFTEEFAPEIITDVEGDWEPAFAILGPLAERRLISDLREFPHSQPPIHTRVIQGFSEYCDTNNPAHIRILGRLLARSIKHSDADDWIDDKLEFAISNLSQMPSEISFDEYRKLIYQGFIEGGTPSLLAVPIESNTRALPALARGLNDGLDLHASLYNEPRLLDAFKHIPHDVVLAGLENCKASMVGECLRRWENLDATSKESILDTIEQDNSVLTKIDWADLTLPKEVQPIFYKEAFFDSMWKDDFLRSQFVTYVECFPNLPEHVLDKFIDKGHTDKAFLQRRSFQWNNKSKSAVLSSLLAERKIEPVIENLDFFPDASLRKLRNEHPALASFKADTKLRIPELYKAYQEVFTRDRSAAKALLTRAHDILDATVTPEEIDKGYKNDPLYPMIFEYAFPGASYEKIAMAEDRSEDLELFEVPRKAALNLLAGKQMLLKKGLEQDASLLSRLNRYIQTPRKIIDQASDSQRELQNAFDEVMQSSFSGLTGESTEAKLLSAIELAAEQPKKAKACRRLAVLYHALREQNFDTYAAASQDRIDQAPNRDYAYLLELREFLETVVPDSVKEAIATLPDQETRDRFNGNLSALFEEDLRLIDIEINKYKPEGKSSSSTPSISAFITKCSQSTGMPFAAGVCVAGDVPREGLKHAQDNMWQTENYFNLVFRD